MEIQLKNEEKSFLNQDLDSFSSFLNVNFGYFELPFSLLGNNVKVKTSPAQAPPPNQRSVKIHFLVIGWPKSECSEI